MNWLTQRISRSGPSGSFIFPSASSKIRSASTFSASRSHSTSVSPTFTPSSTTIPALICATRVPSTSTAAWLQRWTSARIAAQSRGAATRHRRPGEYLPHSWAGGTDLDLDRPRSIAKWSAATFSLYWRFPILFLDPRRRSSSCPYELIVLAITGAGPFAPGNLSFIDRHDS